MPDDLLIARNPEDHSKLPYLVRIPVGDGIVIKARETWPRTSKVYCHRADGWPVDAEIVERLPVRSATKRGAAIDLVLERQREFRSQFVITQARGREMIFWQSAHRQTSPAERVLADRAGTRSIRTDHRGQRREKIGDAFAFHGCHKLIILIDGVVAGR